MKSFYLYAGIYSATCSFASLKHFVDFVAEFDVGDSDDLTTARKNLALASESLLNDHGIKNESSIRRRLVAEDLLRIDRALLSCDNDSLRDLAEQPFRDLDQYLSLLRRIGAELEEPRVSIVETFPAPYGSFTWAAYCPDKEDEKRYGIPQGMYFRKSAIRPYYTQALLGHEIIHCIPGGRDGSLLAMGLEEGIAELLGSLYLTSMRHGRLIARNVFAYSRHSHPTATMWKLYLDHARQAAVLYKQFGLTGLVYLLNQGRRAIHEIEAQLNVGSLSRIELPKGEWNPVLDELVNEIVLCYPHHYTISAIAYYLLPFIQEGALISEICEKAEVPLALGREALEAVSTKTVLFVIDGERIGYSNVNWYVSSDDSTRFPIIRYEI